MHAASLDEGAMWATALALKELTAAAEEVTIGRLAKKAVGYGLSDPTAMECAASSSRSVYGKKNARLARYNDGLS